MDAAGVIKSLFGVPRALIGVVHTGGLPGTPSARHEIDRIVETAVVEARVYASAGFHGVIIENTHDRPYLKGSVGPEIVASMAVIGREVRRAAPLPLGVRCSPAPTIAPWRLPSRPVQASSASRGHVFAHVADEGLIESSAGALLRYRFRAIGADRIRVFADIKKKHSGARVDGRRELGEDGQGRRVLLADGVIVSGIATGQPADVSDVQAVARAVALPTLVGPASR
jgi:membrane complex biogenesis BtpA family protein